MLPRDTFRAMRSAALFVLCSLPQVAYACPVCFAAKNEESRIAFIATTGFLTALPLCLLGGLIYWVVRRSRALDAQEAAQAAREARAGNAVQLEGLPTAAHQTVDR